MRLCCLLTPYRGFFSLNVSLCQSFFVTSQPMNCLQLLRQHYGEGEGYALYRMLMEERFGLSHTDILLGKDKEIPEESQASLEKITARLLENEPLQYILGYEHFFGHKFAVESGVLIPRRETELLVHHALEKAQEMNAAGQPKILDIGTGSGCIAVSMALAGCEVTAMDVSRKALDIASRNAQKLGAQVIFVQDNILQPSLCMNRWDVIVSNPPYVCLHEMESMNKNVLEYEPVEALFVPDYNPLIFYKAIASYALSHLNLGGWLCLEINEAYPDEMGSLLSSFGFQDVQIMQDQYDKKRFAFAHI